MAGGGCNQVDDIHCCSSELYKHTCSKSGVDLPSVKSVGVGNKYIYLMDIPSIL